MQNYYYYLSYYIASLNIIILEVETMAVEMEHGLVSSSTQILTPALFSYTCLKS